MVQLLSELREPPVVGRYYMVPVVHYTLFGRWMNWPVLGAVHHDREHIGFEPLHYHLDGRFLSARQLALFKVRDLWLEKKDFPPGSTLNAKPLAELMTFASAVKPQPKLPRKPALARRKCHRAIQPWVVGKRSAAWRLAEHCGTDPIRRRDGRILCPHRKADLSQFPVESDGFVTCPLHGLRVRVAVPA